MDPTIATQIRQARVQNYQVRHEVTTAVTDQGALPSTAVFVMEILDPADPQQDRLVRIAGIPDFTEYLTHRPRVVREDRGFYRTSALTLSYASLVDAQNAALQIQDQLNRLVTDYQLYLTEYSTGMSGETIEFPTPNLGLLTPLIASYRAKVDERVAQEAAVTAAQEAVTDAQAALSAASAQCLATSARATALSRATTIVQSALTALTTRRSENQALAARMNTGLYAFTANKDAVDTGLAGVSWASTAAWNAIISQFMPPSVGAVADEFNTRWFPAQTLLESDINSLTAELTALQLEETAAQNAQGDCQAAKDEAQTAADEAAADLSAAQATLTELQAQEEALLDQVENLCPDFTP